MVFCFVACDSFEDFSQRLSVQVLISHKVSVLHIRKKELLTLYSLYFCRKAETWAVLSYFRVVWACVLYTSVGLSLSH